MVSTSAQLAPQGHYASFYKANTYGQIIIIPSGSLGGVGEGHHVSCTVKNSGRQDGSGEWQPREESGAAIILDIINDSFIT